MTTNLLEFDLNGLTAFCEGLGEKRFRATQLFRWIHQRGASDFDQMSDLAKSLREKLRGCAHVKALPVVRQQLSQMTWHQQHLSKKSLTKWSLKNVNSLILYLGRFSYENSRLIAKKCDDLIAQRDK